MNTMQKKVYMETLGCQMNKADSEKILGILKALGYNQVENYKEADLMLMNTCTIRASAEDKAFSHLGVWNKLKQKRPETIIGICGCVAQEKKDLIFKRAPYVDLIFGTHNIEELPKLLTAITENQERQCSIMDKPYSGDSIEAYPVRESTIAAWVNVIEGCDYFCTYCIVPYVRGRQRSRPMQEIITEVKRLVNEGYKEVTLLGQTVDSYGNDLDDPNVTLPALLRELSRTENLKRIRFVTSHPNDITDELIDTVAELDKVCEYFHIPMQSGNTEVLKRMKRKYTAEEYRDLVQKIREKVPDVSITSDFIVAFPGETEEQFMDTVRIVDELCFDQCNTAMYSPRKRTPAATWREHFLSDSVKKERINILNAHVKESARRANEKYLHSEQQVLVEDFQEKEEKIILTGRTRNNKLTHFEGDKSLVGEVVQVVITEISPWSLKGKLL